MKRIYLIAILITIVGMTAMAQDRPDMTHQTGGGDRDIHLMIFDMPSLAYDADAHEIIVQGTGSEYYTVTITSQSTQVVVLETVIDGDYDIIDVSSLETGTYIIALTSSQGNTYKWTFNGGLSSTIVSDKMSGRMTGNTLGVSNGMNKLRE